jgi:hypothetical protein
VRNCPYMNDVTAGALTAWRSPGACHVWRYVDARTPGAAIPRCQPWRSTAACARSFEAQFRPPARPWRSGGYLSFGLIARSMSGQRSSASAPSSPLWSSPQRAPARLDRGGNRAGVAPRAGDFAERARGEQGAAIGITRTEQSARRRFRGNAGYCFSSDSAASGSAKRRARTAPLPRSKSLALRSWSSSRAVASGVSGEMRACTEIRRLHPVANVTDFGDGGRGERADYCAARPGGCARERRSCRAHCRVVGLVSPVRALVARRSNG